MSVQEFKCPACAAALKWGSGVQKMTCEYCDNTYDIDTMMEDYELTPEKIEYLKKCKDEIAAIYSKYEGKGYSLSSKINEEILSPEVINYLYEHNKYPENPSKTFMEVTADFEVCFDIEQQIHDDIKRSYAKNHNIKLLEIWYWDFDDIENILQKEWMFDTLELLI